MTVSGSPDSYLVKEASRRHLIVFTRFPRPGKTKTRLIPALGADGASNLQTRMTENCLAWAKDLREGRLPVALTVAHDGGNESRMRAWLGPGIRYQPQPEGHLGIRMISAMDRAFMDGAESAVIIGTDIPNLTTRILETAFESLKTGDIVLGPARDGGYYLIGIRKGSNDAWRELFSGIPWGTGQVLSQTLQKARLNGLSYALTPCLSDVDELEDLHVWAARIRKFDAKPSSSRISIIISTLNEAARISHAIGSTLSFENTEVIVVDGGSTDATIPVAKRFGVRILQTLPGRAIQMNAGARAATGRFLLFLHADTRLPADADRWVRHTLSDRSVALGAFSLSIDALGRRYRWIEKAANFRSRVLGLPYGDQAIFLRRRTFDILDGFPEAPIMEDFSLVRRARRLGQIVLLPAPAVTSGRRWRRLGVIRTTLINQAVIFGYAIGVSLAYLSRFYRKPG